MTDTTTVAVPRVEGAPPPPVAAPSAPTMKLARYVVVALTAVVVGAVAMFFGLQQWSPNAAPVVSTAAGAHAGHGATRSPDLNDGADPEGEGVYISPAR